MPWDGTELWVGEVGPDGTHRRAGEDRGRAGGIDLPAGVVAGRHALLRLGPRRAGGICTGSVGGSAEPLLPMEAEFGRAAVGVRDVDLCVRGRRSPGLRLHPGGHVAAGRARPADEAAARRSICRTPTSARSTSPPAGPCSSPASPSEPLSLLRMDLATQAVARCCGGPRRSRGAASLLLQPGAGRVSDRQWADGAWALLSAPQPGLPRPGGRAAAAAGQMPRRAHRGRVQHPLALESSTGPAGASPCWT